MEIQFVFLPEVSFEIDRNEKVEYTVLLEKNDDNNDIKKTFKSEGKGNDLTNIDLGKLEEGNYSVTVKAEQGNYSDGIKGISR